MKQCKKKLSKHQIFIEFGKDDDMDECNQCENLEYKNGIITCKMLESNDD